MCGVVIGHMFVRLLIRVSGARILVVRIYADVCSRARGGWLDEACPGPAERPLGCLDRCSDLSNARTGWLGLDAAPPPCWRRSHPKEATAARGGVWSAHSIADEPFCFLWPLLGRPPVRQDLGSMGKGATKRKRRRIGARGTRGEGMQAHLDLLACSSPRCSGSEHPHARGARASATISVGSRVFEWDSDRDWPWVSRCASTAWIDLHRPGRIHEQAASSRGGGACACAVVVGARREKGGRALSLERSRGEARERMRRQNQSSPDPHPSIDHPTPRRPSAGLGWAERVFSFPYASIHSFVVGLIDPPFPPTHTHTQQNRQQAALAEEPQVKPWPRT